MRNARISPVSISGFLTPYPSPGRFHHLTTCVRKQWRKSGQRSTISLLTVSRQHSPVSASTTVNIYQPYGIVQTGSGSVANFTQQFDDTVRQQLAHALDAMEQTIEETHELSSTDRAQIREVVREIRAEVSESSPNVPRLQGLLIAAATTIQTLGSAASAYALLKAAAALIGVHLP
jgi:hypothetical protein